jgi:hypothetical protein
VPRIRCCYVVAGTTVIPHQMLKVGRHSGRHPHELRRVRPQQQITPARHGPQTGLHPRRVTPVIFYDELGVPIQHAPRLQPGGGLPAKP